MPKYAHCLVEKNDVELFIMFHKVFENRCDEIAHFARASQHRQAVNRAAIGVRELDSRESVLLGGYLVVASSEF
ncbi:hypothetical protein [Microcystis phage Mae-Yong924-2]|nr:hypothetical protein [Microcystis phage Mae-Yong924-2]